MSETREKIEGILHLNGCQQRTAGWNEAKDGKEMDMEDMERLEELTLNETMYEVDKAIAQAQIDLIDYIFKEPTGPQIMTVEEMKETKDENWRDEVIQYFFNTDSLMFNLQRKREALQKLVDYGDEPDQERSY